jgi:hypothetical protein
MAGTLYITEYAGMGVFVGANGVPGQMPFEPPLAEQTVATAGVSSAFNAKTTIVRLHCQANGMSVLMSTAGTAAATTNKRLAQNQTEYVAVPKGQAFKVAAVDNV